MPEAQTSEAETIGARLRRLRLERGLSQRDLSGPGITYAYISRIEAGARHPSVKALRKLAAQLGISPEYLETGSDLAPASERELMLADAELRLRLDDDETLVVDVERILRDSIACGDAVAAARARVFLGMAAARRGDNGTAIRHLEGALDSGAVSPSARPDVFCTLGRAYADAGMPQKAVELFERALEETKREAPGDQAAHVRYATYLSFALTDLGELVRARAVVAEAMSRAQAEVPDPYTRVRLYWSLGRIAHEQARPAEALEQFRRAVALLELTEDTLHLARAHLSAAGSAILTGELDDADRDLERAELLLGLWPEPGDRAVLRRMQADLAVAHGDGDEAIRRGRQAVEAAGDEFPNQRGLALAAIAAGLALNLDPAAGDVYREAIDLLGPHGTRRERNDVLLTYGRYLRSVGRDQEALDVLDRAADVAGTLQTDRFFRVGT
jgi:transcriptional regulator with XRE-family HTH domain